MEQLTVQDASFIDDENTPRPMHIGGVSIYDPSTVEGGKPRFKDILQFIEDRLHLAKTFRRKIVEVPFNLDHPLWIEDKNFDLEFHVRQIRLPEPCDWRQVCKQVARLHSCVLDMTKAPWEITFIEGLDAIAGFPAGSYALVTEMHHACIDGVAGADITEVPHSLEPYDASPSAAEKPWRKANDRPNSMRAVDDGSISVSVVFRDEYDRTNFPSLQLCCQQSAGSSIPSLLYRRAIGHSIWSGPAARWHGVVVSSLQLLRKITISINACRKMTLGPAFLQHVCSLVLMRC